MGCNACGEQVSLNLITDNITIGQDIVLTCTVHGIQTIDRTTTRQWSMGDDDELICYNGRINNLRKYDEKILFGNEFCLTIFNITEADLNIAYQCRYGFDAASKLIEADKPTSILSLRLENDLITFGGDIILTCTVNGIRALDSDVTRQWSMGNHDQLLSYNGRINNHRKYKETIFHGNAFSLKILNVTVQDVNVTYRCRYGFDTATYFIKMSESASLQKGSPCYHSSNIPCRIAETHKDKGNLTRNDTISFTEKLGTKTNVPLLATLIPSAIIVVAVAVIYIVIAKRKHQRKGKNT
ncbi:unnamed protein product [Mytilus edulis]|uniref:Ig-like domain-containing protein n=1 Tax=Mytilus edulis TaxID=6550 RepID=A0A8S3QLI2_MYTED|nr:unnamed protein product [Mytilus edulis]